MDREDARLIIYHVTHYDKFRNHIKYVLNFFFTVSSQTWQYYKLYFNSRPELHLLAQRKQFLDKHTHSQTHTYTHTLTHTHPKSVIYKRRNHEISQNLHAHTTVPILQTRNKRRGVGGTRGHYEGKFMGVVAWSWFNYFSRFLLLSIKGSVTRYEVEHI